MRLGVFGGTFDPIHIAHLVVAANARHAAKLDTVLFVVANVPWQKVGSRRLTPAEDRLALVDAALQGRAGLEASDIEIRRGNESFTADTLAELSTQRPGDELFLIIGADVAAELSSWERVEEIYGLATLIVVNRPGIARPKLGPQWRALYASVPALDISSTELRARVSSGRPLEFLIPDPAIRCIAQRSLYSEGESVTSVQESAGPLDLNFKREDPPNG